MIIKVKTVIRKILSRVRIFPVFWKGTPPLTQKTMLLVFLVGNLFFSTSIANPIENIQTYDLTLNEGNHVYILFNSSAERTEETRKLERKLWKERKVADHIDSYRQPWKFFEIKELEAIFGKINHHYLLMNPVYGERTQASQDVCIGVWPYFCTNSLEGMLFYRYTPKRAAIVEWGCGGELYSALDLGVAAPGHKLVEWRQSFVLGSASEISFPTVTKHMPRKQLPAGILLSPPYSSNLTFDGLLLEFKYNQKISIGHSVGNSGADEFYFVKYPNSENNNYKLIDTKSIFSRC